MQAIIMAAGKGDRMSQLANGVPKSFLEIRGKAIIDYQIELANQHGVSEIIIVVGYRKDLFHQRYAHASNIRLIFNPFYATTNVLTSFWFGMPYLTEEFLYFHADTFFDRKIFEMLVAKPGPVVLPVDRKRCGKEEMKVLLNKRNQVIKLSKEIPAGEAMGEFIGIAKISEAVLPALKAAAQYFVEREEFSHFFEAAIQKCIDDALFLPEIVDVANLFWNEIDFPEDYKVAKRLGESRQTESQNEI
jgi:choline kinase